MDAKFSLRVGATLASIAVINAGCASRSDSIEAQYISDVQYNSYSCNDISEELARVSTRVSQVAKKQDDAATADAVSMGVGMVLFWPALFALALTDDQEAELSRLKGEHEALQRSAKKKDCSIQTEPAKSDDARKPEESISPTT